MGKIIDITNNTYERLTVIGFSHTDKHGKAHWKCRCSCGNEITASANLLKKGHTKSCGCLKKEVTAKRGKNNLKDLKGKVFGKLTVLERADGKRQNSALWLCRCECGTEKVLCSPDLVDGRTKSCGCLRGLPYKGFSRDQAAFNLVYKNYKRGADSRGFEFTLTEKEVRTITKSDCYYCKASPSCISGKQCKEIYIYNGIDRIDNTKGYTIDNIVPCCNSCNRAKFKMTIDEFAEWVKRISANVDKWSQKV